MILRPGYKTDRWIQKRATPISKEQRAFWLTGHAALTSMHKAVKAVAGEVAKHEGGDVDAALRTVHAGLSPIYRTVRRLIRLPVVVVKHYVEQGHPEEEMPT